jgi:hypothetical protein
MSTAAGRLFEMMRDLLARIQDLTLQAAGADDT